MEPSSRTFKIQNEFIEAYLKPEQQNVNTDCCACNQIAHVKLHGRLNAQPCRT